MPTVLTWTYEGKDQIDEENGDVQRVKAGGIGIDDILGEVTIVSLNGSNLTVETGAPPTGRPLECPNTSLREVLECSNTSLREVLENLF